MCQCVDHAFDQSVDVLRQEEFVGMQPALQELPQGQLHCLQEKDLLLSLDFDAIFKGSGLQFKDTFAFHPAWLGSADGSRDGVG